ncbi:hypothetical protein AB0M45_29660 [Nocardia sp. NPDC051787]|uniref:hypothetical protein n=1 Tax=Nocardia sp. NPDC051787 TaxID=3155415 RepID=UPI003432565D
MLDASATQSDHRVIAPHEPFAQLRETHTGLVVLCGDRAYKAKKPVVTDFLDFGTPEKRELACARELELNQRLAPDVYLGLAHLTDPEGGPGEPIIVMRRMPDALRLSALLADPTRMRPNYPRSQQLWRDFTPRHGAATLSTALAHRRSCVGAGMPCCSRCANTPANRSIRAPWLTPKTLPCATSTAAHRS